MSETDIASVKVQIVSHLRHLADERKLTQTEAGELMGIAASEVAQLFGGDSQSYRLERLLRFLTAFNHDVEITVRPRAKAAEEKRITFTLATA